MIIVFQEFSHCTLLSTNTYTHISTQTRTHKFGMTANDKIVFAAGRDANLRRRRCPTQSHAFFRTRGPPKNSLFLFCTVRARTLYIRIILYKTRRRWENKTKPEILSSAHSVAVRFGAKIKTILGRQPLCTVHKETTATYKPFT